MGETKEGENTFVSVAVKEFRDVWAFWRRFDNCALELSFSSDVRAFGRSDFFWLLRRDETFSIFSKHFCGDAENDRRDIRC